MDYEKEMPYAYWLHNISGVGNKGIRKLLSQISLPSSLFGLTREQMLQIYCKKERIFTEKAIDHIEKSKEGWKVLERYNQLKMKGIDFYPEFHPAYPGRLRDIPDAPWAIYAIGTMPDFEKLTVAVVGARQCSAYGAYVAKKLGKMLAERGVQVISGMAVGIDSLVQQAALSEQGKVAAVLGSGVDVCYPLSSKALYDELKENGVIISEYPPGTEPRAGNFPARNRIISGLSHIVAVVEAKEKSGTLITVDMALEQGRDVYAVPGRMTDALSIGCNRLLKQGAAILLSAEEWINEIMEDYVTFGCKGNMMKAKDGGDNLDCFTKKVLGKVDFYPKTLQKLYDEMGEDGEIAESLTCQELLTALMKLETEGKILTEGCFYSLKS